MKRAIRQRCGFGCVICGLPLHEYEHMLGFATVQRHVAEEITLLCDQHHRERTNGLLSIEAVREANASPFNFMAGVSRPYDLHFEGDECEVQIGSNRFTMQRISDGIVLIPVMVDGIPLIAFTLGDGHLFLSVRLFDGFNNVILAITDNELVYKIDTWDIHLVGRNLILREAERKILLDITFAVPNRISIDRGRLLCNGVCLEISPHEILVLGWGRIYGNTTVNCQGGLIVGPNSPPQLKGFFGLPNLYRYPA